MEFFDSTAAPGVLEICPYEPPPSGWTTRVKLLRKLIRERGRACDILDIGPGRTLVREGCVPVLGARDYLGKVGSYCRRGYTVHTHVNGEYYRGVLLALAAAAVARARRCRVVTTFHAGHDQPFLRGPRGAAMAPHYRLLFGASAAVVCNSETVRTRIAGMAGKTRVVPIPAFSRQYLEYETVSLAPEIESFLERDGPVVSTYVCFRDGFYVEDLAPALARLRERVGGAGLVVVGTGPRAAEVARSFAARGLSADVAFAGGLGHDAFMTLLARSRLHLRTPTTDGVSSTVLEALSLGVPVIASDNGSRPPSVLVYPPGDPAAMGDRMAEALRDREELVRAIDVPEIRDTATPEVELLLDEEAEPRN